MILYLNLCRLKLAEILKSSENFWEKKILFDSNNIFLIVGYCRRDMLKQLGSNDIYGKDIRTIQNMHTDIEWIQIIKRGVRHIQVIEGSVRQRCVFLADLFTYTARRLRFIPVLIIFDHNLNNIKCHGIDSQHKK